MANVLFVPARKPAMAVLVSLLMCILLSVVAGVESNNAKKPYYENLGPYFEHDIVAGSNATDQIAVPRGNTTFGFGALRVFDNALTITKNPNSTTIGCVQGFGVVVSFVTSNPSYMQHSSNPLCLSVVNIVCTPKDSLDGANYLVVFTLVLPNGTFSCVSPYFTTAPGIHKTTCNAGTGEYNSVTRGYVEANVTYIAPNGLESITTANIYYHKDDSVLH